MLIVHVLSKESLFIYGKLQNKKNYQTFENEQSLRRRRIVKDNVSNNFWHLQLYILVHVLVCLHRRRIRILIIVERSIGNTSCQTCSPISANLPHRCQIFLVNSITRYFYLSQRFRSYSQSFRAHEISIFDQELL